MRTVPTRTRRLTGIRFRSNRRSSIATGVARHVSEVTIAAPGVTSRDRQIQAILTRNIYRAWFAHPKTAGITWWNTVDGGGVYGEPLVSGLFTRDMKVWGQSLLKAILQGGHALYRFRPCLRVEVTERIGRGRWRNEVSLKSSVEYSRRAAESRKISTVFLG